MSSSNLADGYWIGIQKMLVRNSGSPLLKKVRIKTQPKKVSMRTKKSIRHDEQQEREIDKTISKFSQRLMSNSKWVKLMGVLIGHIDKIHKIEFKKVQGDEIGELYLEADTTFGFDYWHQGFEEHNSLGGVLAFKEIEYLLFPRIVAKSEPVEQDINYIEELIKNVGDFCLDKDEQRLKLICYKE